MILIVNHKTQNCGVYQFGKRFADLAAKSNLEIAYREIGSPEDYNYCLHMKPEIIIYNWYPITMGWLSNNLLPDYAKNHFIFHDGHIWSGKYHKYIFNGALGPPEGATSRIPEHMRVLLPRPLFNPIPEASTNKVPTIGSFGFGFWHKGFHDIVTRVNEEFDNAVINLHIPNAHFGDENGKMARDVIKECIKRNIKKGIKLNITSNILDELELLRFLSKNDLNVFMYGGVNEGISSVVDYALSARKPIGVTNNMMFRHILSDEIIVEKNSFREIIERGTKPLEGFYDKWSPQRFIEEFEKEFGNEGN